MSTATGITRHGIALPLDRIADLCRRLYVRELALFGSFLGDDFGPESDLDFLVDFRTSDLGPWSGKLFDMQAALEAIVGRRVDLVLKDSVEGSPNPIRRQHILGTAKVIQES